MTQLSVIGTRVDPVESPSVEPACPREGCSGTMQRPDSVTTLHVPVTGQTLVVLRCSDCRDGGYYLQSFAYSRMPEGLVP